MKQKRDREEACSTCGHYHDEETPCSICGHVIVPASKGQHESCMPATIVPGYLYLGSYDTASRQDLLKAMGITHVLNTVPSCPALYRNTFNYHTVSKNPPDFEECFGFLDEVHGQQQKVLVYCMSGLTRSPTVVIAYLMKLRGWRLAESYKWVKDKKPNIKISEDDTKRLQEFEMKLLGSCSAPSGFAFMSLPALAQPTAQRQQHCEPGQQQQQQQQQQQSPCTGFFGLAQQPPWANNTNGGGPAFGDGSLAFTGGGNFVFGSSHPAAAHHHAAEAEMET